jgi:RHS repeat-associated protein
MAGASLNRTYDPRNLLLTTSRANGVTSQNAYDALGRVLSATHTGPAGVLNNQTYTYDPIGNRANSTTGIAQALVTQAVASAVYDVNNEQSQFGSTTNTFDANGNLASSNSSSESAAYAWDSRNRLASITTSGGQTTRFTYDFEGHLIQQTDAGSSLNLTQLFLLDDFTNVAYVSRNDGDRYSVLAGRSIDDHIAVTHASGQIEYGLGDALNSTAATVDQAGAVKGRFFYEPFGQTTATDSTYPFQYTGRIPTSSTVYYYRARYYQPGLGRFLSEDPRNSRQGANRYKYAANNPVFVADPRGLETVFQCALGCFADFYGPSKTISGALLDGLIKLLQQHALPYWIFLELIKGANDAKDLVNCLGNCIGPPPNGGGYCGLPVGGFPVYGYGMF